MFSVAPEIATGIFLILIFAFWLKLVRGATVFGEKAPWSRPDMLILPVLDPHPDRAGLCAAHHPRQHGRRDESAIY